MNSQEVLRIIVCCVTPIVLIVLALNKYFETPEYIKKQLEEREFARKSVEKFMSDGHRIHKLLTERVSEGVGKRILERDNYQCRVCGSDGLEMSKHPELRPSKTLYVVFRDDNNRHLGRVYPANLPEPDLNCMMTLCKEHWLEEYKRNSVYRRYAEYWERLKPLDNNGFPGTSFYPDNWNEIRQQVLRCDGNSCGNCGVTTNLHVHHIVPLSKGDTNKLSNLRTLCEDCHKKLHPHMRS